ncbi:Acyl transferase/acyl hydrolase/lysophospholipase [Naviculisporaceae sp. PSN 640]
MATVAGPLKDDSGASQLPQPVSALRSSQSVTRRRHPHVSIVVPKTSAGPDASNPEEPSSTSATPLSARNSLSVTSTPWAKKLILTLDGGGIRGYSSLIILRALMKEIADIERTLEPKATSSAHTDRILVDQIPPEVYREGQYLPCHYFDYIAGTSVGGLIGIMLVMMGKSVDECIAEFHGQKKAIPLADSRLPVPSVPMELPLLDRRSTWPTKRTRSFFDLFAQFSVSSTSTVHNQSSSTSPVSPMGPSAAQYSSSSRRGSSASGSSSSGEFKKDTFQCQAIAWCAEIKDAHGTKRKTKRTPYAFCSYKEEDEEEGEDVQLANTRARANSTTSSSRSIISIPEVAKAITNPWSSWFKPFRLGNGQFVDGSKLIRDPTLGVIKEISSLLSPLSTDDDEETNDEDEEDPRDPPIDLLLSLGTDEHHVWFYEKLRRPKLNKKISSAQQQKTQLQEQQGISYHDYHRFEVPNLKLPVLRRKLILAQIEQTTEKYLAQKEVQEQIRKYAQLLVERRRERAQTSRWEVFALGVKYFCHHVKIDDQGNVSGCNSVRATQGFDSRGDYYEHLEKSHKSSKMARKKGRGSRKGRGSVKGEEVVDIEAELDKGRRFGCS